MKLDEKLKELIQTNIGDLISDEDIKAIVAKGIEEFIFKGTIVVDPYYSSRNKIVPPYIETAIKEQFKELFTEQIKEFIEKNSAIILAEIPNAIGHNTTESINKAVSGVFFQAFSNFELNIMTRLQAMGVKYG